MSTDLRRHKRYRVNRGYIRASWLDRNGTLHAANVKVLDISRAGIAIELPEPLLEFAKIKLKSSLHGLDGTAVVRRCKFSGVHYVIGLEFEDIQWTPPPGPARMSLLFPAGCKYPKRLAPFRKTTSRPQSPTDRCDRSPPVSGSSIAGRCCSIEG